jgi:hypothetical protein
MKARHLVVMGVAALVAGCGGTTGTPSTSAPSTSAGAGSGSASSAPPPPASTPPAVYYVTASSAVDAAYAQWTSASAGVTDPTQLAGPAATYGGALTTFDNTIVDIGATGHTASDIAILVIDDNAVISDLNQIGHQTAANLATWEAKLQADQGTALTEGDVVRSDLGLPPG